MSFVAAQVLLVVGVVGALAALNALRPAGTRHPPGLRPPWLFVMLTTELVPLRILMRAALLAVVIPFGALDWLAGRVGLALTLATWVAHAALLWRSRSAGPAMRAALTAAGVDPPPRARLNWPAILVPYPYSVPAPLARSVLEYAPGLELDTLRLPETTHGPVLLHVHGGGWRGGHRRQQARPLLHEMALRGWVAVAVDYPLVPRATFPDQLVALKRAVARLRSEGAALGIDPDRIFVTGGSAGAHLASLLALTPGMPEYQPGFEAADTSLNGAVMFYGIYDLLNRNRTRDPWPVIPRGLMKSDPALDEARYRAASPLDQVGPQSPPFLVVHGAADSLVPTAESRQFATALRDAASQPVVYVELPGATHSFDVVPSLRTQLTVNAVAHFLDVIAARDTTPGSSAGN